MTVVFGVFLLTLLLITAFAIVRTPNLFVAVMLGAIGLEEWSGEWKDLSTGVSALLNGGEHD